MSRVVRYFLRARGFRVFSEVSRVVGVLFEGPRVVGYFLKVTLLFEGSRVVYGIFEGSRVVRCFLKGPRLFCRARGCRVSIILVISVK